MDDIREPTDEERSTVIEAIEEMWDQAEANEFKKGRRRLFTVKDYSMDMEGYSGPVVVALHGDGSASLFGLFKEEDGDIEFSRPLGQRNVIASS